MLSQAITPEGSSVGVAKVPTAGHSRRGRWLAFDQWRPLAHLLAGGASGLGLGVLLSLSEMLMFAPARGLQRPSVDLVLIALVVGGGVLAIVGALVGLVAAIALALARREPAPGVLAAGYAGLAAGCLLLAVAAISRHATLIRRGHRESAVDLALAALAGLALAGATFLVVRWLSRRRSGLASALPRRSAFAATVLLVAVALVVGSDWRPGAVLITPATSPAPSPLTGRPNVLLVTIDTLRADHVHAYGHERIQTPNLDAVAADGVRFDRAIVQQPNTNASHASIFTGTYPHTHGVRVHMVDRLSPTQSTLASLLRTAGYTTAGIYSWVSLDPAFSGLDSGFEEYHSVVVNRPKHLEGARMQYLAATCRRLAAYLSIVRSGEAALRMGEDLEEQLEGRADVTTNATLEWLAGEPREPFFLWVHYYDPHYPFSPPPPYDQLYDPDYDGPFHGGWETIRWIRDEKPLPERDIEHIRALYDGKVSFTDEHLGRLLADLDRRGLTERTILIVTADHGGGLGEKSWFHPGTLFDTETRVPLLIRSPGLEVARKVVDAPVQSVDILPTVLDLIGIPVPESVEGRSLVPLMLGREDGEDRLAFSELPGGYQVAVVSREWKLIVDQTTGSSQLYHVATDPKEEANLAGEQPHVVATLRATLEAWVLSGQRQLARGEMSVKSATYRSAKGTTE